MAKVPLDEITHLDDDDLDVWSCNNCGAYSLTGSNGIRHYDTCVPGEAKKWERYYSQPDDYDDD